MQAPANQGARPSAEPDAGCGRASKISREISPFLSPHQVCGACPDPPPPAGRQHVMPFFRGDLPEALVALVAASLPPTSGSLVHRLAGVLVRPFAISAVDVGIASRLALPFPLFLLRSLFSPSSRLRPPVRPYAACNSPARTRPSPCRCAPRLAPSAASSTDPSCPALPLSAALSQPPARRPPVVFAVDPIKKRHNQAKRHSTQSRPYRGRLADI